MSISAKGFDKVDLPIFDMPVPAYRELLFFVDFSVSLRYNLLMELKEIVAKNLIYLRKKNNLTQQELAQKINYSDNAISRWERGEVAPGLDILEILANFYKIKIQDLFDEDFSLSKKDSTINLTRILTILFVISIVWALVIICYVYLQIIMNKNVWLLFIAGVPASCLAALFFNNKWGNRVVSIIIFSLLIWSILTLIFLAFLQYKIWPLFLLGIPSQSAVICWYFLQPIKKQKVKKSQNN